MTLNILFLTITISRRKRTMDEENHQQFVEQIYEQNKDRQFTMYRSF